MALELNKALGKSASKTKYSTKKGINMARNDPQEGLTKRIAIIGVIAVVFLICLLKFGIIDQNAKLTAAQLEYDNLVAQNNELTATTSRYGEVQIEYRTYSMEWANNDDSRFVTVQRQDVLDLMEKSVFPCGTVENLQISDNTVHITMNDMTLEEISQMILDLQASPIVASASLNNAASVDEETNETAATENVEAETAEAEEGTEEAEAAPVEETESDIGSNVSFSITITLQAEEAGEEDAQ